MFFIRAAFWIAVVALFLPFAPESGSEDSKSTRAPVAQVSAQTSTQASVQAQHASLELSDAVGAVTATAGDVLGFCDRNPQVCQTGTTVLVHVRDKALAYGAALAAWAQEAGETSSIGSPAVASSEEIGRAA